MTNYTSFINLLEVICELDIHSYIHAGSSSEYGLNSSQPNEDENLVPNSHYAISKAAASGAIEYMNIFEVANINSTLKNLKEKNFWVN